MDFMDFKIKASYVHGSSDSVDKDIVYILEEKPDFNKCKMFCATLEGNPNLAVIEDGHVVWCYKGSKDELNNSLFRTIPLHSENGENPIVGTVERDVCLKVIRAVRGILSHISRSQYREKIKSALGGSFEEKLQTIEDIDIKMIDFDSMNKNMSGADILKLYAFQIGQTLALIDGVELYTKKEIGDFFPSLRMYLFREKSPNLTPLKIMLKTFVTKIRELGIKDCGFRVVEYNGQKYDTKTEEKYQQTNI